MVEYTFMFNLTLTPFQRQIVERPIGRGRLFLEGASGTGKTTTGAARLLHLLDAGVPADSIAVITPQRSLALPYVEALRRADLPPGGQVRVTTFSGIAREQVALYWEMISPRAGFAAASAPPTFLSLETAQYVMAHIVTPLIEDSGYFETVTLPRGRLYSQLLDNLNKAAIGGFALDEVSARLKAAWAGDPVQTRMYDEVQDVIARFRAYCLTHHLLDFSLLVETFMMHTLPVCADRLFTDAPYLFLDNIEEENAATTRFFGAWLARCESALVIFDSDAGYRRFLGADEDAAYDLHTACDEEIEFADSFVMSANVGALRAEMALALKEFAVPADGDARAAFNLHAARFTPEMLDWAADTTGGLIAVGVPPRQIAIMAPFMTDALRFSMLERLAARTIPARSHRPSRSLRDEPVVRALLTLAKLAHPSWGARIDRNDLVHALMAALSPREAGALDLARAHLLTGAVYAERESARLAPFESIPAELQERLTYTVGEKYDRLREWLDAYITETTAPPVADPNAKPKRGRKKAAAQPDTPLDPALDHFFSRLFGEVLSARGYGLHRDLIAADAIASLVESARGFRRTLERTSHDAGVPIGREYIAMIEAGVIANQYTAAWLRPDDNAVLVAPAYTFLMDNRAVDFQIWLDIGGRGWSERVFQPLTHPIVLSRQWDGAQWDDAHEQHYRHEVLYRLVIGLLRRCRQRVYWGITELGETGTSGGGDLLETVNRLLRRLPPLASAESDPSSPSEEMPA